MAFIPPPDLFEQVLHALQGEEIKHQKWWYVGGGPENVVQKNVEVKTVGPERWIRRAHERGIVTPIQLLALIDLVLLDLGDLKQDERRLVERWSSALVDAVSKREIITPRDPDALLPLHSVDNLADWVLTLGDADAFVASMGMEWTCTEIVAHLFNEHFPDSPSQQCVTEHATNADTPTEAPPIEAASDPPAVNVSTAQDVSSDERVAEADNCDSQLGDWREVARRVADELHLSDVANGAYDSITNLAERVAKILKARGINGSRGPLNGSTVLREALQGGRWKRPKPK
ncbi:hypothetical protein [Burkholderia pseudomallei]|uniref:hypothetical protein n=1 Tax=Burkholderia pseudomallei TaxID=28450 RepID=UPI00050EC060|nr:hypothetical protein [Burkholderia pseudomallei]KGC58625.1 hypothetical protein DP56_1334 [Burkholderia pseudomallei]